MPFRHYRDRRFIRPTNTVCPIRLIRNCPGTPRWCPGTPSERRSVGEFALEKLAFRSLARPQAAFCGTTWAVTKYLFQEPVASSLRLVTLSPRTTDGFDPGVLVAGARS